MPLHLAIKYSASEATIIGIVRAWPEAAHQMDKSGDFPLHQAMNFQAPVDATLEILRAWEVAVMLKNQNNDKLPIHYAVVRATDPRVIEELLRVYPQSLDVTSVNEKGRAFTARDMTTHLLPEESIRMVMKPVAYWERIAAGRSGIDIQTKSFDALSVAVDELEAKVKHGQGREHVLLEKIKILEAKLRRLAVSVKSVDAVDVNGDIDESEDG